MADDQKLYFYIDDTDAAYAHEHPEIRSEPTLEDDLFMLLMLSEHGKYHLDPEERLSKLKEKLRMYGMKITPDTDIKALAEIVRISGIADHLYNDPCAEDKQ